VLDKVDAELVVHLRSQGKSWREIAEAHRLVKSASGKKVRPSVGSIRRAAATGLDTAHHQPLLTAGRSTA
jgi:hypothetical protein